MVAFALLPGLLAISGLSPVRQEFVCQGCEGSSTYSTSNAGCDAAGFDAGLVVTIIQFNGGCATLDEICVASFPCTPLLTIEAWVDDLGGGFFRSQGTIAGVGTGRVDNPVLGQGPSYPVKVYSDYSGVNCGNSASFHFNVAYYEESFWFPGLFSYVCTMSASGSMNCSGCVPCYY